MAVLTAQVVAQTAVETDPQAGPRDAPQKACQVASADVLPIALQPNFQVAVEFGSATATRDALDFATRFAPRSASIAEMWTPVCAASACDSYGFQFKPAYPS